MLSSCAGFGGNRQRQRPDVDKIKLEKRDGNQTEGIFAELGAAINTGLPVKLSVKRPITVYCVNVGQSSKHVANVCQQHAYTADFLRKNKQMSKKQITFLYSPLQSGNVGHYSGWMKPHHMKVTAQTAEKQVCNLPCFTTSEGREG